jgi:hypothetical protein
VFRRRLFAALLAAAVVPVSAPASADEAPAPTGDLTGRLDAQQADLEEQDAHIKKLEKKIAELAGQLQQKSEAPEKALGAPAPIAPPVPAPAPPAPTTMLPEFLQGIVFSSYVQAQYEHHQDSEDQLRQGGVVLNQDRFVLRRARLKIEKEWEYASILAEIDGNSVKGPAIGFQHAEASILYRGGKAVPAPPLLKLTLGLFDVPFGYELTESPKARYFTERSLASRSFFPAEPDLGLRVGTQLGWLRASVALMNGEPLGEKSGFSLRDPNSSKDIVARAGAVVHPTAHVDLAGGVSVLNGKGFHPGTDAGKASVVWKDVNENGQIDAGELTASPATSPTLSQSFDRWAVGADLRVGLETPVGWLRLSGEVTFASNLDRGLFVADPVLTSIDSRELGVAASVTQEISKYGVVGLRFDTYDPNADSRDRQGGKLLPSSQAIRTFSPMVGLMIPGRARLLFQYDLERDKLGRDPRGVPTDLANDTWTLRLQVEL